MQRGDELYSGKAKSVYTCERDDALILHFRDDTSAFDGEKMEALDRKGMVNNKFNAFIMEHLESQGVKTHFLESLSDDEALVRQLDMFPITFEFFLKNDELHDPMINEYHIDSFGWADKAAIDEMQAQTFKVNGILSKLFADAGMILVDFKLEFGRQGDTIYLGDEFTPDGCRIWDSETREKLDKDRFRKGLGGVVEAYEQVAARLGLEI